MLDRARAGAPEDLKHQHVGTVQVSVAAATAARGSLIGARRRFALEGEGEGEDSISRARTVMAEQISGRVGHRVLQRDLKIRLQIDQKPK